MNMNVINIYKSSVSNIGPLEFDNPIYSEMKTCLGKIYFTNLPADWENYILSLIPKKYKKKYFLLMQSMLKEVRDMYVEDMRNYITEVILFTPNKNKDDCSINHTDYRIPNENKAFNYDKFINRCKLLSEKYFLCLEPIKIIINIAHFKLPTIICNFDHYCSYGLMSLSDFQNRINTDIRKSLIIIQKFYTDISKTVIKTKVIKCVSKKNLSSIMQCITHVFVQQIVDMMIRSTDHLLNILNDGHHCPQIKFQLILQNNQLLISPNIEEVHSVYHSIIDNINTIAQDLIPLEEWLNMKPSSRYIKVKLPDWYLKESHNKLHIILCKLFQSMNEHVAYVIKEFYPICIPAMKDKILSLASGEVDFDLYLMHIQTYKTYVTKTNAMVKDVCYTIGKLEQHKAKESLHNELGNIVNAFLIRLVKYHHEFNTSICSEFEDLKVRALNIPRNAQSLIKLSEYISHASKILVEELECKIQKSIRMLSSLLEITILPEDHIELNKKTISWMREIVPIFKQHHVLCEAMKNELEDDMQNRINDLNFKVDDIVPELSVLNNMDDIDKIGEYIEYYKNLLKSFRQINYEMRTINEEETLFKFPETEFPKIIELQEIIMPFYDLIYIIHQWQKDNAVWLDGPFEWLDATVIEKKTLNYFEKVTEMGKSFKAKIKMDVTLNKCFKFVGIADDPDPMQLPAPLKLCWQALNSINDFKRYLPLVMCVCNPALTKRHWIEISQICNFDLEPNAGTSLRKIISLNLMDDIIKYDIERNGST